MHTCKSKAIMNLELKQINHTRRHGVPSFSLLRGVDSDLLLELNLPSEWGKCRSLSTATFDIWPQLDLRVIEAASCFRIASSQSIGLSNKFLETKAKILMKIYQVTLLACTCYKCTLRWQWIHPNRIMGEKRGGGWWNNFYHTKASFRWSWSSRRLKREKHFSQEHSESFLHVTNFWVQFFFHVFPEYQSCKEHIF